MTERTDTEATPTCYRHPGRETYVRCTRCDRPICPDCMHTAAVGFQCPECVREGHKSVRQARTVFGGRVGADANVTKVLIALNVIAFVAQLSNDKVTNDYVMQPLAVAFGGQWYRMLTSAFLHDTGFLLHIAFNMYALLLVGSQIERLLGTSRYLVLYVVAAFGGSVATMYFVNPTTFSLGASGAVFGLFGAFFVLLRKLRADTSQVLTLIGINLAIGFAAGGYINNAAHIGGLVSGGVVAFAYAHAPEGPRRTLLQYTGAALVAVALLVATAARVADWRGQGYDVVRLKAEISDAAVAAEVPSR
ncbi:MAG TPA: rhomboid family intramembrane serine protease [Mycobacteriales bacterium]|jgi:membrane associated rhomboid family serine protease